MNNKDDLKSMKSVISSTKRSAAGKFEGLTQFGEHMFIKNVMSDKIKRW